MLPLWTIVGHMPGPGPELFGIASADHPPQSGTVRFISSSLYFVSSFVSGIFLVNLMIAQISTTYEEIRANSEVHRLLLLRTSYFVLLTRGLPASSGLAPRRTPNFSAPASRFRPSAARAARFRPSASSLLPPRPLGRRPRSLPGHFLVTSWSLPRSTTSVTSWSLPGHFPVTSRSLPRSTTSARASPL